LRNDLTDDINDLKTYTDSSLNLLRTYVDTQDNLKVNKSGDTMTDYLRVPEIRLTGQTTTFNPNGTIDAANKTNTYAVFENAGAATDWAFLRQIGGSNDIHLSLDFHDDNNDGKFSLRNIVSTANPNIIKPFFFSSPSGTNIKGLLEIERDNTDQILLKSNAGGIQEDTGIKFNHSTKDVGLIQMRTVDTLKQNGGMSFKVIKNNALQTLFYVDYDEVGCLNSLNLNLNKIRNLDGGTNVYDAVNKGQLDLKSDTTYVNTQLATKVNKSGDTMTGNLTLNENLSVVKKINASHIQLVSGANANSQGCWIDWNFNVGDGRTNILNQKGGGTGGIAFGEVSQTNVRTYNMILDGNGNLSVAGTINRSSWLSGELIQTKVYNQSNSGSGVLDITGGNGNNSISLWKDLTFTMVNTTTDSDVFVEVSAPFHLSGSAQDVVYIQLRDCTNSTEQEFGFSSAYYGNSSGGGV
jgi:hypothetical protein